MQSLTPSTPTTKSAEEDRIQGANSATKKTQEKSASSIVCAVTTTNKARQAGNQDSCAIAKNKTLNMKAVIVADGIGSCSYAERASKFVVENVRDQIEGLSSKEDIDVRQMFSNARAALVEHAEDFCKKEEISVDKKNSFGTTLIVSLEDDERVKLAYVGDGAIWHIRGNFNYFHVAQLLPWNALNYLNPHSVQNSQGIPVVYRLISISDDESETVPTILEIVKDNLSYGDIFMICTDGIYSFNQVCIARHSKDGSIWVSGEKTMSLFYQHLSQYFAANYDLTDNSLAEAMHKYLNTLNEQKILDDDATIGVIITAKAIEYQKTIGSQKM